MSKGKFHIITYGCQMNKNDSERIAGLLQNVGMSFTDKVEEADLVLLNSCSVRQTAEDRIFGRVKQLAKLRKQRPNLIIGVTGCMAGRDKDGSLRRKLPQVDLFFPTVDAVQLPRWIAELNPDLALDPKCENEFFAISPEYSSQFQAFVPIQTGCNNFCSYCVVPHARGLQKNRPLKQLLDEINNLAKNGCLEITLLGQAVNTYEASDHENFNPQNPYKNHFAALLWEVNQISGIERIFFTAAYPKDMTDEVIDALALPKMWNYLHLPVQSGDNEVLKRMNRKYTREEYLEI
ncbi:MAG: MiaB/RimO family radical SAM methylthiotransferase, partial [Candidatus Uhrbacteria bacterium]